MRLLAGQKVPAGLSYATVLPDIDFETYSEAGCVWREDTLKWVSLAGPRKAKGIAVVGASAYAEHPSTEILSAAYDLKDGNGPRLWTPGQPDPVDLFEHVINGGLIEAHNSFFEYVVWFYVATGRLGWPALSHTQLRCSSSKARANSYPGGLGKVSEILGCTPKDTAKGRKVITRYCIPRSPTKSDHRTRIRPSDESCGIELYEYNIGDIEAEADVSLRCPDLSEDELAVWLLDQEINIRGVQIDTPSVAAFASIVKEGEEYYNQRMQWFTDGYVQSCTDAKDLLGWLHEQGVHLDNLEADTIRAALKLNISKIVKNVLRTRTAFSSAGIKKLIAMTHRVNSDGRMRDQFVFYRAITGRWSSEGLQLQNMKSSGPNLAKSNCCDTYQPPINLYCTACEIRDPLGSDHEWGAEVMSNFIDVAAKCDFEQAHSIYGDQLFEMIGASMRGMVIAGPGNELLCSDYSAIEAVTLSVLAGEQWRIDVFRTHGKIYEMCAAKLTGKSFEEIANYPGGSHPDRKPFGKVPELASGYQGWIGAWLAFGADKYMDEDTIKHSILQWRADSPMIVELWGGQWREKEQGSWDFHWELYGLEGTAIKAVLDPGRWYTYRFISYGVHNDVLYARLPSGRCLAYHQPRLRQGVDRRSKNPQYVLSHMINNTNPQKGKMGWIRVDTYGGMLTENANQAVARDLQANGMRNLAAAGYPIVAHVHDEIIAEVPTGYGSVEEFERLMMTMPDWAQGWPVKAAGGWRGQRYRKE